MEEGDLIVCSKFSHYVMKKNECVLVDFVLDCYLFIFFFVTPSWRTARPHNNDDSAPDYSNYCFK